MTASEFKERFARLGPTRRALRVPSGSSLVVKIRMGPDIRKVDTIPAIALLKESGLSLLRAKRTIEAVAPEGVVTVELPQVADAAGLERDLAASGFSATTRSQQAPDVREVREGLGLTQEQFALRFGLELEAVRNWEHKRRVPDTAARSLLKVIARFPEAVAEAQDS